ncbi:TetR/AcrR family transcriptional regulator [Propionibacterium australiense]|nr:TetR/AcrR family transcriptional regulator [Propionibacterium australiense]RLP11535.1 TetR family transcriptional regulator [Propionibacterium australiense]RLP12731.1 TetR family transcriptional regulator [Propionibacterium australiense]
MSTSTSGRKLRRDPDLTKREILDAAAEEFARHGPNDARTDDIAERTNTSKRMIYYYFESKEALYSRVLLENYMGIRSLETALDLAELSPVEGLVRLIRATLDFYEENQNLVRIVALENLLKGGSVAAQIPDFQKLNASAPKILAELLERGRADGVFRSGEGAPDALDVHQVLSALVLNRVEHRATFRTAFGRDMLDGQDRGHVRALIEETVLRLVLADPEVYFAELRH